MPASFPRTDAPRRELLKTYVSPAEKRRVVELAHDSGRSVSEVIRRALLDADKQEAVTA